MIRLFISDIDGCLSMPYEPLRLDVLSQIRNLAERAGGLGVRSRSRRRVAPRASVQSSSLKTSTEDETGFRADIIPDFSICTGRAYPYAEAITQVLGLRAPILFEAGAGMFDPVAAAISWHPAFTDQVSKEADDIRMFMTDLTRGTGMSIDYAKRSQAALVALDPNELTFALREIDVFLDGRFPDFESCHTPVSIDVVHRSLNKKSGIDWLASKMGIAWTEIAFIGDTDGDADALHNAKQSFAPANAMDAVMPIVDCITSETDAAGVLEAYRTCVEYNRQEAKRGAI